MDSIRKNEEWQSTSYLKCRDDMMRPLYHSGPKCYFRRHQARICSTHSNVTRKTSKVPTAGAIGCVTGFEPMLEKDLEIFWSNPNVHHHPAHCGICSSGAYWPGGQPGSARCAFCKIWIMPPLDFELLCLRAADREMHKPVIVSSIHI